LNDVVCTGNTLYKYNNKCLSVCPDNTGLNTTNNTCYDCSENCLKCATYGCTNCIIGYKSYYK